MRPEPHSREDLDQARLAFGRNMAAASGSSDARLAKVFAAVHREDFLPPAPWLLYWAGSGFRTRTDDPAALYQDVLVALDPAQGINNGEPYLHAAWIGAVEPRPGETVAHLGAGTGYYTAMLAMLVEPGGHVEAFEIDGRLAEAARRNLEPFGVAVHAEDASAASLPPSDVIYVNASVTAPPLNWLDALKVGGRLIFPWQPTYSLGVTLLVRRLPAGFSAEILGGCSFIACKGAREWSLAVRTPTRREVLASRSLVPSAWRPPDETATAIYRDLWFSTEEPRDGARD